MQVWVPWSDGTYKRIFDAVALAWTPDAVRIRERDDGGQIEVWV